MAKVLFVPSIVEIKNNVENQNNIRVAPSAYMPGIYVYDFDENSSGVFMQIEDSQVYINHEFLSFTGGLVVSGVTEGWNWLSQSQRDQSSIVAVWLPPIKGKTWAYAIPMGIYNAGLRMDSKNNKVCVPTVGGIVLVPEIAYGIPFTPQTKGWIKRKGGDYPTSGQETEKRHSGTGIVDGQAFSEERALLNELRRVFGEDAQISVSGNIYIIHWTAGGIETEEIVTSLEYRNGMVFTRSVGICVSGADRLIPYDAIPSVVRHQEEDDQFADMVIRV